MIGNARDEVQSNSPTILAREDAATTRHLDTCQIQTQLHARVPLAEIPEHGV